MRLRAPGTPHALLTSAAECGGIPDFLIGSEWARSRSEGCPGVVTPCIPHLPYLLPSVRRREGPVPGSTIAGRGCGGTTWWINS